MAETLEGAGGDSLAALSAGMAPRDAYEDFLVAQMAAAHEAALDCFDRAAALGGSAAAGSDRPRAVELRLGARLASLFRHHGGAIDRHRTALYRERAALYRERAALRREHQAARKEAEAERAAHTAAGAPRTGVVVEPLTEPMETIARRFAAKVKTNKRWHAAFHEARADDAGAKAAAAAAVPDYRPPPPPRSGPGCLVVPEKPSPEEWSRGVKAYKAALREADP